MKKSIKETVKTKTTKMSEKIIRVSTLSVIFIISVIAITANATESYERVAAMSPDVAEILVELGAEKKVVGKDALNKNPALKHAKTIGTHRNLTVESVLAVKPDLAVGTYMVQPQSVYQRLNALKIKAINVASTEDAETFANSISQLGVLVGKETEGKALAEKWRSGMQAKPKTGVRYLLSYDGRHVAGKDTVGDMLINLAGGVNAGAVVNGFKPLTREAWLKARPDVIIIAQHNMSVIGSKEKFLQRPEVRVSPAGKNKNVLFWSANEYLRYGLDSPKVVKKLHNLAKSRK